MQFPVKPSRSSALDDHTVERVACLKARNSSPRNGKSLRTERPAPSPKVAWARMANQSITCSSTRSNKSHNACVRTLGFQIWNRSAVIRGRRPTAARRDRPPSPNYGTSIPNLKSERCHGRFTRSRRQLDSNRVADACEIERSNFECGHHDGLLTARAIFVSSNSHRPASVSTFASKSVSDWLKRKLFTACDLTVFNQERTVTLVSPV